MHIDHSEIIKTEDGSHSLYSSQFDQKYHSLFGAIQESEHVFLRAGLLHCQEREPDGPLNIAEIGFGSGLNAYLVGLEAQKTQRHHTYWGLEKYPIDPIKAKQLNYAQLLGGDQELFNRLHTSNWGEAHQLTEYFSFRKMQQDMLSADLPKDHFHTFFYDAFSPETQPELWTADTLKIAYDALRPGGVLVTYCAKGDVKRALRSLGFTLEKNLPGPAKKREMTRATKAVKD